MNRYTFEAYNIPGTDKEPQPDPIKIVVLANSEVGAQVLAADLAVRQKYVLIKIEALK